MYRLRLQFTSSDPIYRVGTWYEPHPIQASSAFSDLLYLFVTNHFQVYMWKVSLQFTNSRFALADYSIGIEFGTGRLLLVVLEMGQIILQDLASL